MFTTRMISTLESHVEGLAYRTVVGGIGALPGRTMAERRTWLASEGAHIRALLMNEPRGHSALSGAILQEPTVEDADWGVVFIESTGVMPMCGAGTIAVACTLVEAGMVTVTSPVTTIRIETPIGLVTASVAVENGRARSATIVNTPSFMYRADVPIEVERFGRFRCDIVYGGNFYAVVDLASLGIDFARESAAAIIAAGSAIMAAVERDVYPRHPERGDIHGCKNTILLAPGSDVRRTRHVLVNHPGWIDRSPSGTGTSALLARLVARGEIDEQSTFVNESFLGTAFEARVVETVDVAGASAVVPSVTGRAWMTGSAQFFVDPDDPFPEGFVL